MNLQVLTSLPCRFNNLQKKFHSRNQNGLKDYETNTSSSENNDSEVKIQGTLHLQEKRPITMKVHWNWSNLQNKVVSIWRVSIVLYAASEEIFKNTLICTKNVYEEDNETDIEENTQVKIQWTQDLQPKWVDVIILKVHIGTGIITWWKQNVIYMWCANKLWRNLQKHINLNQKCLSLAESTTAAGT